ncbi:MAG: hypothetical protein V7L30_16315 [Nostoc sp.]|uniref:hypothetical protein n=1 Tax=Nostoc sp. TaxID=1180 RepID=UPI002FFBAC6B
MAKFLGLVFSDRIKTEFINVRLTEHPYPALYVNYLYLTGALGVVLFLSAFVPNSSTTITTGLSLLMQKAKTT